MPFPEDPAEAALDRALAFAHDHRVDLVGCWVTGLDDDRVLESRLHARGFRPAWVPHWMAAPVTEPAAAVGPVHQVLELEIAGRARATVVLPPERAIAGLFGVHVDPAHRRQGLGTQLTHMAIGIAAREGRGHLVLNATGEGELLYRSLGFESLGRGRTWYRS